MDISKQTNTKGFTLIELLVVIAIIGLLASVVLVALSSSRQKSRDAKRISDVKQLSTALEVFYTNNGAYPQTFSSLATTYIGQMPTFPTPTDNCTAGTATYAYTVPATPAATYQLLFCLAASTGGVTPAGTHTLTQSGIQ